MSVVFWLPDVALIIMVTIPPTLVNVVSWDAPRLANREAFQAAQFVFGANPKLFGHNPKAKFDPTLESVSFQTVKFVAPVWSVTLTSNHASVSAPTV